MGSVLPFPERRPEHHCACEVAPEPQEPPRMIWSGGFWKCSACGAIIRRDDTPKPPYDGMR